jgi:hypothetical protein
MKEKEIEKYCCGECGNDSYYIYRKDETEMLTECTECHCKSILVVRTALKVEWYDDAEGIMCLDWD